MKPVRNWAYGQKETLIFSKPRAQRRCKGETGGNDIK